MPNIKQKRQFSKSTQRVLFLKSYSPLSKPVPIVPAQSTKVLHGQCIDSTDLNSVYDKLSKNEYVNRIDLVVIELLLFHGCRISEVLRISPNDVLQNGYIKIKGLKGSNDRLVYPYHNSKYWLHALKNTLPIGPTYSRFYFYRLFKRLGLYELNVGKKNKSVTHSFRHKLLQSFNSENIDIENRKNFIGHKSIKSTKHYE